MEKIKHIKVKELDEILQKLNLPDEAHISVTIEEDENTDQTAKKIKTQRAIQQLKDSGTGSLVEKLLQEREKDKQQ